MPNKIGLFLIAKNEADFIRTFLEHNLPVFDEATLIDNGSTDGTLEAMMPYRCDAVTVHSEPGAFKKASILNARMKPSKMNILVPMDADELMIYDDGDSVSKNPAKIREYMQSLEGPQKGMVYKIRKIYQKHPDSDWWGVSNIPKVFYTNEGFIGTDEGNHGGSMRHKCTPTTVNISYLDYRYHTKEYWERRTLEKIKARLGERWQDMDALRTYKGISGHAVKQYLHYIDKGKWHGLRKSVMLDFDQPSTSQEKHPAS
jgi:glycosyltransferase involved in cell wall biosynthesis